MSLLNGSPTWMYSAGGDFYPYLINQSLRFNAADSPRLLDSGVPSSGNRKKFTFSFWVKLGTTNRLYDVCIGAGGATHYPSAIIGFHNQRLTYKDYRHPSYTSEINSTQKFRDNSSWYHCVCAVDTTQSTASNRVKLYVNGNQITAFDTASYPSQNYDTLFQDGTSGNEPLIGFAPGFDYMDGYLAEVHNVDNAQLSPSDFGELKEGIWIPKEYTGSYGTTGYYFKFVAGAEGTDSSGNGHDMVHTPGNTSRNRPTPDTPTNNFCLMPYSNNPTLLAKEHQGMRINTTRTGYWDGAYGSFSVKSGKWYYEVQMNETAGDNFRSIPGWKQEPEATNLVFNRLGTSGDPIGASAMHTTGHYAYLPWSTNFAGNGGYTGTKAAASKGDVLNVAVDFDNNKIYFGLNGTYAANDGGTDGDPANGTNESLSGLYNNGKFYSPSVLLRNDSSAGSNSVRFNFGHDRSFGANLSLGTAYADENGFGEFRYAVPSGFLALCSQNLPNPEVDPNAANAKNPTDYFNAVLYSGNAGSQSVTVGFAPDFVWAKNRNQAGYHHDLYDRVRGDNLRIFSSQANAEATGYLQFANNGFSLTAGGGINASGGNHVAWNWKAGGSPSSNSNGSITSSVSANTEAGFSVVSYTGNGGSSATVGHGLTQAPDCIWLKHRTAGEGWVSFWNTPAMGPTKFLGFNSTGAASTSSGEWNNTAPTNTVFTIGNQGRVNTNNNTYIAYCFHNVDGFQKTGIYYGNANADGPEIRCGFRPAFILIKNTADAEWWTIIDNERLGYNETNSILSPNSNSVEYAAGGGGFDILSNGFKVRGTSNNFNGTGDAHVYIAFADQPMKYVNAR